MNEQTDTTIELNKIYNEDCMATMKRIPDGMVDIILTSPPYNTSTERKQKTLLNSNRYSCGYAILYDIHTDDMTPDQYIEWSLKLFAEFNRILKKDGCILYNVSYGSSEPDLLYRLMSEIAMGSEFTIIDQISWKKNNAMPNTSHNKLTRLIEPVFVLCRKTEKATFHTNKKLRVVSKTGTKSYENIYNLVEAKRRDVFCEFNRATYSSELCEKLLNIYAKDELRGNMVVYDPFIGTGTTAIACKKMGLKYIGSELSENQVKFANDRLEKISEATA